MAHYIVKWTAENGKPRKITILYEPLAISLMKKLVVNDRRYDCVIIKRGSVK